MKYIKSFLDLLTSLFPVKTNQVIVAPPQNPKKFSDFQKKTDFYVPQKGNDWNPVLKFPRNEPCYCGSGIKFKKCCLPNEELALNKEFVEKAKPLVKHIRDGVKG